MQRGTVRSVRFCLAIALALIALLVAPAIALAQSPATLPTCGSEYPCFYASSSGTGANCAPATITGIQSGDVIFVCGSNQFGGPSCPSGFTEIDRGGGIVDCYKIAGSGESGSYALVDSSSETSCAAEIIRNSNGTLDTHSGATGSGTSPTLPSLTSSVADDAYIGCLSFGGGSDSNPSGTGITSRELVQYSGSVTNYGVGIIDLLAQTAATYSGYSGSQSSGNWVGVTAAFEPGTATPTPSPTPTPTPTESPTPLPCAAHVNIHLLNSSAKIMNGTASSTQGSANLDAYAVDTSGDLVNSFTGTASTTTGYPAAIVRFVDSSGMVCNGTSDSGTSANYQATVLVCSAANGVIPCNSRSSTPAAYNYIAHIVDANGFIDNNY